MFKPSEQKTIEKIVPSDPTKTYSMNYSYESMMGKVDAVHEENYEYILPFEKNSRFKVLQGVGGRFSHSAEDTYYSYDFKMPVGTPIVAARSGSVIKVVEGYVQGGNDARLKNKSNIIYIEHEDGTIGVYGHLVHNGAIVNVGDYVQAGQRIGYSGHTGYADVAHLHFGVMKAVWYEKYRAVPIKIDTASGTFETLQPGMYFTRKTEQTEELRKEFYDAEKIKQTELIKAKIREIEDIKRKEREKAEE